MKMRDREQWRSWLEANHGTERELWLTFYKTHVDKVGLGYEQAVEEALCFGWIDGLRKRVDDETYTIRFSPRHRNSVWSPTNKRRVARMIEEGRMTEAGLVKVREAKASGRWAEAARKRGVTPVPSELGEALERENDARQNFETLAPSYRRQFVEWVAAAKREETRRRRVAESIRLLAAGERLGMK